jgi:hypothetical protein
MLTRRWVMALMGSSKEIWEGSSKVDLEIWVVMGRVSLLG